MIQACDSNIPTAFSKFDFLESKKIPINLDPKTAYYIHKGHATKSVSGSFILVSEFCERFTFYGIKTVLVLYFLSKLDYDRDESTIFFHIFISLGSFFTLVGAVVADKCWGKFLTILIFSFLYAIGAVVLTFATVPEYHLEIWQSTLIGLGLIGIGAGCVKPCISAFGTDQFQLPKEALELAVFFALFHLLVRAGSMLSIAITPFLRANYSCYDDPSCFALAFALPAVMMILGTVIFIGGYVNDQYIMKPHTGNMFDVTQCILSAVDGYVRDRATRPRKHFLDYAEPRVGHKMVSDTKIFLKMLLLYIPLSFFWALYDQQGSRWTLQATRLDGQLFGYTIEPDQMQLSNQLLMLILVPLFDYIVYPILSLLGIKAPLQKITIGGVLAALAFVCAASLETKLDAFEPILPNNKECQLRLYNTMECDYIANFSQFDRSIQNLWLHPLFVWKHTFPANKITPILRSIEGASASATKRSLRYNIHCPAMVHGKRRLVPGKAISYFYANGGYIEFEEQLVREKSGNPIVRPLLNIKPSEGDIFLKDSLNRVISISNYSTKAITVPKGNVTLYLGDLYLTSITTRPGGIYTILGHGGRSRGFAYKTYVVVEPYSIDMMSQLPQYVLLTTGEIMFTMNVLEFSFTQAPKTIKSVLQVYWLLTNALGNMLVVLIVKLKFAEKQSDEFMLFAHIMFLDMIIFIIMAICFKNIGGENAHDTPRRPVSPATPRRRPTRSSIMVAPRPRPSLSSPSAISLPQLSKSLSQEIRQSGRRPPPSSSRQYKTI